MLSQDRPEGVRWIAGLVLTAAAYLLAVGTIMLAAPGAVSMRWGAPLLGGLELAGPYMFLLAGGLGLGLGYGLLRLWNWARRVTIVVALVGLVMLVPTVSSAVISLHVAALISGDLGVIVRVIVVWYLYQAPVGEAFQRVQ